MPELADQIVPIATANGCVDPERLETILEECKGSGASWISEVLNERLVDERSFLKEVALAMGMDWWDEDLEPEPLEVLRDVFPAEIAIRHQLLPAGLDSGTLILVTWNPFDLVSPSVVSRRVSNPVSWKIGPRSQILEGLQQVYGVGADTFEEILQNRATQPEDGFSGEEATLLDAASDEEASVLKFVNHILRSALDQRATDIHLEPLEDQFRIRFRVDGLLSEVPAPPEIKAIQSSVVSRLKIMAKLDIAEKRLPQDGRIRLHLDGTKIDVRVATIPSIEGETVSLRLLGQESFSLGKLGLNSTLLTETKELLAMPNGIILITGPTGSGKSTSLYCFLSEINTTDRRIVTIEDPVENKLRGVIQIAVKPDIDLTFANGLRSVLRGDPDVVMVGEMRDLETTEIAIRAALTGHLVFSTLHTNDALSGITRLIDMGVEPFLVSSSVRAFIAQRLVRKLCVHCRQRRELKEEERDRMKFPRDAPSQVYRAGGCNRCRHTGYHGRIALFEMVRVTPALEELINRSSYRAQLAEQAVQDGLVTMREYGWAKVLEGETSVEEVLSVTPTD